MHCDCGIFNASRQSVPLVDAYDNSIHIEIDASELEQFVDDLTKIPNDPKVRSDIGKILSHALEYSTDWAFEHESDPNNGEKWKERVIDREYADRMAEYGRLLAAYNVRKAAKRKGKKGEKSKGRIAKPKRPAPLHKKLQLHPYQGGSLTGSIQEENGDGEASIKAGVGSNIRYARIHQLGGLTGRGHKAKIPARPYLGLTQQQKEKAATKIGKLLVKAINALGKKQRPEHYAKAFGSYLFMP
ncbi:MAG: phage virion morphogenesis protein [bacterium]|nr:phage virion morphogenesis protein [bacterium]